MKQFYNYIAISFECRFFYEQKKLDKKHFKKLKAIRRNILWKGFSQKFLSLKVIAWILTKGFNAEKKDIPIKTNEMKLSEYFCVLKFPLKEL